jgi:catechol 2,3-dioxygenase-like lactoylglutathione lyase family enzyme
MLCGSRMANDLLPGADTMNRFAWVRYAGTVVVLAGLINISAQTPRPHITGISHLCVYASDPKAAEHFYVDILGAIKGADPEARDGLRYYFSGTQFVEVMPLPAHQGISRMDHVAFNTDNADALRSYLTTHGTTNVTKLRQGTDGSQYFDTADPEGNKIQFVQPGKITVTPGSEKVASTRVIHIGFLVHNRAAEDAFYKTLLSFKPYWYGAMQPGKVDWVSEQVPDGHDWLEYMLVGDGSDTPLAKIDQRELGVLNHFSLGVPNMEQTVTMMYAEDRLPPRHDGPQMGKDGKWQANFYDPDGTRVEFMEFQPVMKPCCSDFTAASPTN